MVSHNLMLSLAMLFLIGAASAGRVSIGFVYIQELVPADMRPLAATCMAFADSFTMIYATIYFEFISKNSIYWEGMAFMLNLAGIVTVFFYLPESPKWLYEKGLYQKAKQSLKAIADGNGVERTSILTDNRFESE